MTILPPRSWLPFVALVALLSGSPVAAQDTSVLWWVQRTFTYTVASHVWTSPAADVEAADDFDVHGTITRIVANASGCSSCAPPTVAGVTVRFYQSVGGTVGPLQYEAFVPAGAPELAFRASLPEVVELDLPAPFAANGQHFVSMQMHFVGGGYWNLQVGNTGQPIGASVLVRDRLGANQWVAPTTFPWPSPPIVADLSFELWGLPAGSTGAPAVPCTTWSRLDAPIPAGSTNSQLRDVKVFAPDDVWATGLARVPNGPSTDTRTLVQHWDGRTWTSVPSPSPGPAPGHVHCTLNAIDGTSSQDLWVAGGYEAVVPGGWVGQNVFAMHWDGQSWTVPSGLPLPNTSIGAGITGSRVLDLVSIASDDVWFVGDWLDLLSPSNPQTIRPGLLMHWNGSGFALTLLPVVTGVGHQYFNAVAAHGPNDIWVVGGAGVPGNLPGSPTPVLFHWNGSSWTHRPCPAPPGNLNLYDVEVLGSDEAIVFGTATVPLTTNPPVRFMAHYQNGGWTLLPGPPAGLASKAFAANDVWSLGAGIHHWDGSSWTDSYDVSSHYDGWFIGVDGVTPCQLVGVGARSWLGDSAVFAARQDDASLWNARLRWPQSLDRAPCVLRPRSAVRPGEPVSAAVDDPAHAVIGSSAWTFWLLAAMPIQPGVVVPFGGRAGGPGEALIDPTLHVAAGPVLWTTSGGAVELSAMVPADASLIGLGLATQALLLDTGAPQLFFSNALDLQIGL